MQKVLSNHNLLGSILQFIIDDYVNLFRVCKIPALEDAERLAQYRNGMRYRPMMCENGKCTCPEEYRISCDRQKRYRIMLNNCSPLVMLPRVHKMGDQILVMMYMRIMARPADVCGINIPIFDYFTKGTIGIEIARLFVQQNPQFIRKYIRYWKDKLECVSFGNNMLAAKPLSDQAKQVIRILHDSSSLIEEWPVLRKLACRVSPKLRDAPFVDTLLSPDGKKELVIEVVLKTYQKIIGDKKRNYEYPILNYNYSWRYAGSKDEKFTFGLPKEIEQEIGQARRNRFAPDCKDKDWELYEKLRRTYRSIKFVASHVWKAGHRGYNMLRWESNDELAFVRYVNNVEGFIRINVVTGKIKVFVKSLNGNINIGGDKYKMVTEFF